MQIFKPLILSGLLLGLSACGAKEDENLAAAESNSAQRAAQDGRLDCALAGETRFSLTCSTERISDDNGTILVIRHPDGGFRRLRVLTNGRGLEVADGSEKATISIESGNRIMVTVANDRYLMPATVKSKTAAPTMDASDAGQNAPASLADDQTNAAAEQ